MKEVAQLYNNDFGLAFYWKKDGTVLKNRIQFIFKEMGFYLLPNEVEEFKQLTEGTINYYSCRKCSCGKDCHKLLLKTPIDGVDLAVTKTELVNIKDLMEGVLFNLGLNNYLDALCDN